MAKRFISPDWKALRKLPDSLQRAWFYMWDKCDEAGVYEYDSEYMKLDLSLKQALSVSDLIRCPEVVLLPGGQLYIKNFIEVNYGTLKEGYNPHKPAFRSILKYNLSSLNQASMKLEEEDEDKDEEGKGGVGEKPFPDCLDDIKPEKPKPEPVTLENPFGKEFHQTHWQNWKIYRTQTLKKPVKPGSESAALKELWDDSGGDPVTAAKMIQKSIANGYQGLFPVNGKANGKPQTANQQIHDLANNGVFLKPPPDKFVEVIQADGQRFTGNLELDNGLIVFVKAGRTRVTIDPQNDFHASCTYKLAPGRTIQEVYEYLINEQMELV